MCLGAAAGCARHGAERILVDRFFAASRLRDRTALQQLATVVFEPLEQGTVTTFTITSVADVEDSRGQVVSKTVAVSAPVRLPGGGVGTRTIVLVLERRDRWIVTGFTVRP